MMRPNLIDSWLARTAGGLAGHDRWPARFSLLLRRSTVMSRYAQATSQMLYAIYVDIRFQDDPRWKKLIGIY
jgi:hypothetical protein